MKVASASNNKKLPNFGGQGGDDYDSEGGEDEM